MSSCEFWYCRVLFHVVFYNKFVLLTRNVPCIKLQEPPLICIESRYGIKKKHNFKNCITANIHLTFTRNLQTENFVNIWWFLIEPTPYFWEIQCSSHFKTQANGSRSEPDKYISNFTPYSSKTYLGINCSRTPKPTEFIHVCVKCFPHHVLYILIAAVTINYNVFFILYHVLLLCPNIRVDSFSSTIFSIS
jgi:hypothetical protein